MTFTVSFFFCGYICLSISRSLEMHFSTAVDSPFRGITESTHTTGQQSALDDQSAF